MSKGFRCAALAVALLCAGPVLAQSIEEDLDWIIRIDPSRNTVAALAEFDNGISLVSRCVDKSYDLIIDGVPEASGVSRELRVTVGDEEPFLTTWTVGQPRTSAFSRVPARIARELMAGGTLKIQVPAGPNQRPMTFVMELDPSSTAVRQTLTACNIPLVDTRYDQYGDESSEGLGNDLEWARAPRPEFPAPVNGRSPAIGYAAVSCIAMPNGEMTQCIVESEQPAGYGLGQSVLSSMRRSRVKSSDPSTPIGIPRTVVFQANFQMK